MIKKGDMILSAVIVLVAVALLLFNVFSGSDGKRVRVTVDGEVYADFSLSDEHTETVKTKHGTNVIKIEDGKVSVTNADCPDKYCVEHIAIDSTGETIVCLPHRMVVEIVGDSDD